MKKYNIAILGATGLVGTTFLKVMEEYEILVNELRLFASKKSLGKTIKYMGKDHQVKTVSPGCFKGIDYALFSAGGTISKEVAKQAIEEGAIVIDNSSAFRMDEGIPLVVPEVNLNDAISHKLIANPNCSTIQAILPLYALDKEYGIEEVTYNTYQAVSGAGYKGLDDFDRDKPEFFPYVIKETCIPQIDVFMDDGYTKEEHKMIDETKKILHRPDLLVSATCIRVPVKLSHAVSIRVKLKQKPELIKIRKTLANQPGIVLLDEPKAGIYPTSVQANNTDSVYVGRIRKDKIDDFTILLYCVADNVRKGAASNAVQIMKGLMDYVDGC